MEAQKVWLVIRFGEMERMAIFSTQENAEIWMAQEPDISHVCTHMFIDIPEYGNREAQ
jgi:hypothetical protein